MDDHLVREVKELHNTVCSALADPTRIMMIYTLADGRRNVTELARELELSQPTTSRHLKNLRQRGLVNTEREGNNVFYSLADPKLLEALNLLRQVMLGIITRRAAAVDVLHSPDSS
jgi:ArsR family transcriptional regulator